MKLCGKCLDAEANPGLHLFGFGAVCYSCFQRGNPSQGRRKAKHGKDEITRPERKLVAFGGSA